jgi:hypothetical protein
MNHPHLTSVRASETLIPMVDDRPVSVADYPVLAERAAGHSYRELSRIFGGSHEAMRQRARREAVQLASKVEAHFAAGRGVMIETPFQAQDEWQGSLSLFQFLLDALRGERNLNVHVQTIPTKAGCVHLLTLQED